MIGHAWPLSSRTIATCHSYHHHHRRSPCAIRTVATRDGGPSPSCFCSPKLATPRPAMITRIVPAKPGSSRRRLPPAAFKSATTSSVSGDDASSRTVTSAPVSGQALKVTALVGCALALCNADRTLMSVAIIPLMDAKGLSLSLAGIVQSAFLWGYAATPLAGGALADRLGPRRVLALGVGFWSVSTMLTPYMALYGPFGAFLATRVALGLGEGVALPCMNALIARWYPAQFRSRAVGVCMAAFQIGSAIGLLISPIAIQRLGLASPFQIFGALGLIWLLPWLLGTEEHQADSKKSAAGNRKKRDTIAVVKWMLAQSPAWSLLIANAVNNYGYFVLLSWAPAMLKQRFALDLSMASGLAALPWFAMAITGLFVASISDTLIASGKPASRVRKVVQSIGFIGPAFGLVAFALSSTPSQATLALIFSIALSACSQAGFLCNFAEVASPGIVGTLHGLANTAGSIAGIFSTATAGFIVTWTGQWSSVLLIASLVYAIGALLYCQLGSGQLTYNESEFDERNSP